MSDGARVKMEKEMKSRIGAASPITSVMLGLFLLSDPVLPLYDGEAKTESAPSVRGEDAELILSGKTAQLFREQGAKLVIGFYSGKPSSLVGDMLQQSSGEYRNKIPRPLDCMTAIDVRNAEDKRISYLLINGHLVDASDGLAILLEKPRPWLELKLFHGQLMVDYASDLVRHRIQWTGLPHWNAATEQLSLATPPIITVAAADKPERPLYSNTMDTLSWTTISVPKSCTRPAARTPGVHFVPCFCRLTRARVCATEVPCLRRHDRSPEWLS